MTEENNKADTGVLATYSSEEVEERREQRNLKTWMAKAFTKAFIFVFVSSVLALLYASVFQEKDLNTTFIGEILSGMFEFVKFVAT